MSARPSHDESVRHGYAHNAIQPAITVGVEQGGTTIDVVIQLRDMYGNSLAEVGEAEVWLSDVAKGAQVAVAPSGGWALQASSVLLVAFTANKHALWLSHTDGKVSIRITEAGAKALFINVRQQGDHRIVTAAVTFV